MGTVSGTTAISVHEANNGFDNDNLTFSGSGDIRNTSLESDNTANVLFNATPEDIIVSGLNSTATSINVTITLWKSTNAENGSNFFVEYSTDGSNFTGTLSPTMPTGSGTTGVYNDYSLNFTSIPQGIKAFRFRANGATTNFRLGKFVLTPSGGLLPVSINRVIILKSNKFNEINWSCLSETNNDFFTIERSADGSTFEAIGTIKGAGNSSREITYEVTDEAPLRGLNYYRIKQTDFDGKYSYSEVRSVRFTDASTITVSPRTTEGRIYVTTDMEDYEVSVLTASGARVRTLSGLSADQSISIEDLQPGIYFIRVSSGTHSETVRVIKI